MEINANWSKPVSLTDGESKGLIYHYPLEIIPTQAGCYVFYNKHGNSNSVLYIGQAENLRQRLEKQQNNLRLMMGIKRSLAGSKNLIFCTIKLKQGQKLQKVLKIVEDNLIDAALANGNELLNVHGTKNSYDTIIFKGNRDSENMFKRKMSIPR